MKVMRKISGKVTGSAALLTLLLTTQARSCLAADTWALIIGVNRYQALEKSSLGYPAQDAESLRDALTSPKVGNVPSDHVKLLTNEDATAAHIVGGVEEFLKSHVKPGDTVIVSLAGHGIAKGIGPDARGYFLPADVKGLSKAAMESSAVNLKALASSLAKLPAAQFIVFVDACRSDPTPGRGLKANVLSNVLTRSIQVIPENTAQPASAVTFFACQLGQRAYEDDGLQHGIFTYNVLKALTEGDVPDSQGVVDMGRMATYVRRGVAAWIKEASRSGDNDYEQTPDFQPGALRGPVSLLTIKRTVANPLASDPPRLIVTTIPENTRITIDNTRSSAGPQTDIPTTPGKRMVKIEAPGYQTLEQTLDIFDGYPYPLTVSLQPGAAAGSESGKGRVAELYGRALDAEGRGETRVAIIGYQTVMETEPKFAPAYERLAQLQIEQKDAPAAIQTLRKRLEAAEPTAHAYSLLSRAYVASIGQMAGESRGEEKRTEKKEDKKRGIGADIGDKIGGLFGKKRRKEEPAETSGDESAAAGAGNVPEARAEALKAAESAIKADAASSEALVAHGLALTLNDSKGRNRDNALAAFSKAAFLDDKDAANHYWLGFVTRAYAAGDKPGDPRDRNLNEAAAALKRAILLRPDYYEAHRELAYCWHLLGKTEEARHEYEQANALRGSTVNADEIAAINLALSSLYEEAATKGNGGKKEERRAAAAGYREDARESQPDLTRALAVLKQTGLRTELSDFLPAEMRNTFEQIKSNVSDPLGAITGRFGNPLRIPSIPGIPGGLLRIP